MTFVIGEKCLGERYATCVSVCPVDCMHPGEYKGEPFLIIDPEECIDCGVCQPECPIDAILETEDDDPVWAEINAELTDEFKNNEPVEPRPANDPPRRADNTVALVPPCRFKHRGRTVAVFFFRICKRLSHPPRDP